MSNKNKKNVLVTGGAGYIGSVLIGHLLRANYKVTVIDSLRYQGNSLYQYCNSPFFDFKLADARDEKAITTLLKTHEVVIPLAALVGVKACLNDQVGAQTTNFESIRLLKELAHKDHQIVFPATNSGYGAKTSAAVCTEDTPLEPISLYGETKVKAETEIMSRANSISLRLATVFGPSARMRIDLLVNDFVYKAFHDGALVIFERDFKRNYIHVDDVADCFLYCLEHFNDMKGEIYNLGLDSANLTKSELALKIKQYLPKLNIQYAEIDSDPDKRNYIVSSAKIEAKGFKPKTTLDQGIQQLITAYRMLPDSIFSNR